MLTKYASLEDVTVLDTRGSSIHRTARLDKLGDFHKYRTEDQFLYARIRAISSRINRNNDGWPSIELAGGQDIFDRHLSSTDGFVVTADSGRQHGFSTFLGKPIFVDHHNSDPSRARGVIVDATFHVDDHKTSSLDPYYSSPDVDPEHLPASWVELLLEVDAKSFPKFAKAIVEGGRNPKKGIDGWSMGCDVEKSLCSICKNAASSPEEYCNHVKMKGAYFDHVDPHTGRKTSKRAYENCYGVSFFEISGVFDPADETALSREVRSKTEKKEPLKELADLQEDEWIDEEHEKQEKRKRAQFDHLPVNPVDPGSGGVECPKCAGLGDDEETGGLCRMCNGTGEFVSPHPGGDGFSAPGRVGPADMTHYEINDPQRVKYGPVHQGSVKTADNPLPQSEMSHAPEKVDTLREEKICPVCGSSMDEDTCDVCTYQESPQGFGNPDLTKAKDVDLPEQPEQGAPELAPDAHNLDLPGSQKTNTPKNPTALAHVTSDTDWEVHTSARINKTERPIVATDKPATNEPQETILADQLKPVTSKVRTAEDFIAAVANKENNPMNNPKVAYPAPPSNEPRNKGHHPLDDARDPEVVADVLGVGGVIQPSNEEASKANGQVDVLGIGGTGVEKVKAEQEGANVEQGTEHSKNIEAIPTMTWSGDKGDSLGQQEPVTSEVPQWITDRKWSHWRVEGHEDGPLEAQEQQGGATGLQDGGAVKGVKPHSETFGDRVDVLQALTSPSNNSGPTVTWSGTDGNGVLKQQEPVTGESIALSESGLDGKPNWGTTSHIFTAFKLARLEVKLGMLSPDREFERAAELERETPQVLDASLKYAQRVNTAAVQKMAGLQKLPVMGRPTVKEASSTPTVTEDDSFMFGGL